MPSAPSPLLGGLVNFVDTRRDAYVAPGHRGGHLLKQAAAGRDLLGLLGRTYDVDRLLHTHGLGDPFDPAGPLAAAEAVAARAFGAERCRFVTNGTSTANKIVVNATVAAGDRVLIDANCHKSIWQAVTLAGAHPTLLKARRSPQGVMLPPSPEDVPEGAAGDFALAVVTMSTYDGVAGQVPPLLRALGNICRFVLFDEAWMAHARFSDRYNGRHTMSGSGLTDEDPALICTQSLHKTLAGLCQTSQILVCDDHCRPGRKLTAERLDTAHRMHSSTSPNFALLAACEANAAAFLEHGDRWTGDALGCADELRGRVPEPWRIWSADEVGGWQDPLKLTLLPPEGMPGYLAESLLEDAGVLVEKANPATVLLTLYPAFDGELLDRLVAALSAVADRWRDGPAVRAEAAAVGELLRPELEHAIQDDVPEQALPPIDAHGCIPRGDAEPVPVADLAGRVVCTEVMAYPPGVALFAAGQRVGGVRHELLKMHAAFLDKFPDLAPALHGVTAGKVLCVP